MTDLGQDSEFETIAKKEGALNAYSNQRRNSDKTPRAEFMIQSKIAVGDKAEMVLRRDKMTPDGRLVT